MKALVIQQPTVERLFAQLDSFDGKVYDGTEWRPLMTVFTQTLGAAFGVIAEINSTIGSTFFVVAIAADDIIGGHGEVPPPPPPFPKGQVRKVVVSGTIKGELIGGLFETPDLVKLVIDPNGTVAGLITPKNAIATFDELVKVDNWFSWGAVRVDAVSSEQPPDFKVEFSIPSNYQMV